MSVLWDRSPYVNYPLVAGSVVINSGVWFGLVVLVCLVKSTKGHAQMSDAFSVLGDA